ncbi:MAG: hypothetical protein FD123_3015 [Bacteroidetes bacterium]|nr:MAG: hypothetical protein FD123_3015 [Bacteroidota bacterium]
MKTFQKKKSYASPALPGKSYSAKKYANIIREAEKGPFTHGEIIQKYWKAKLVQIK